MRWLFYHDDEVSKFHIEFEILANEALNELNLSSQYEWKHHLRLPGSSGIVPDFVLRKKGSNEWILAYEIKRTIRDVYSSRYQYQAKSYAEDNKLRYRANYPLYFVLSNLEVTILFAAKELERPELCRIENGFYVSGSFDNTPKNIQKNKFKADLKILISHVINTNTPNFENIWPAIVDEMAQHVQQVPDNLNHIQEPTSPNWNLVKDYLSYSSINSSKTIFLLRCLMAEYLRGRLHFYGHPRKTSIPPINSNINSVANTIAALSIIDFQLLFQGSERHYLNLSSDLVHLLQDYIKKITAPVKDVANLALSRNDAPIFLESFISLLYPNYIHDGRGKIPTDPELASLLACASISDQSVNVLDPCSGDAALLLAGYERLKSLGASHDNALNNVYGVEADTISVRLGSLRLAMTSPATINANSGGNIIYGDMFSSESIFSNKQVILLNPPFRRYEEQEEVPFPLALRMHYSESIKRVKGNEPSTTGGQPNLFNYFVEFVAEAMDDESTLAVILDNKWYHSKYGTTLRSLLLQKFNISAIIEYPHNAFFRHHDIATSILIAKKKGATLDASNNVNFIRAINDPRSVDLLALGNAIHNNGAWPLGWSCRSISQTNLNAHNSWKTYFTTKLNYEFRFNQWPTLTSLFTHVRRGSLQKEEGGLKVFAFPFTLRDFGPKRTRMVGGRTFQTKIGAPLTTEENLQLSTLASQIPEEMRGFALQNSDDIDHFILSQGDVTKKQCIEPPALRNNNAKRHFIGRTRSSWTSFHDMALSQLTSNTSSNAYLQGVSTLVGLDETVLDKENLWVDLREPYAGELILPRKTRVGHKVHVNPYAINNQERQVRISSNFLSFSGCNAIEPSSGLDLLMATQLIAAFLLSSFGQLQYEQLGNNREGLLSMEEHNFNDLKVFDPRWIRPSKRQEIIDAFLRLPYPISTSLLSNLQIERNQLDRLFADEIINWQLNNLPADQVFQADLLLNEVHQALDEWLIARQP